jgi:hypothetical protein
MRSLRLKRRAALPKRFMHGLNKLTFWQGELGVGVKLNYPRGPSLRQ